MSMPGTPEQKRPLIECMSCHTFERIVRSTYDAEAFFPVLKRMAQYANNTTQARVQPRLAEREVHDDLVRKLAAYLATVNLSSGPTWPYELQTLPRPKGRATHVVITEYDLPRQTIAPHDVRTDAQGHVWYSNFVENFLGELDPKTGAHREYAIPVQKPGSPTGALDLEADGDGNLWLAMMFQTGVAKFDMTTKTFQMFPVQPALDNDAAQQSMVMPRASRVDGKVWSNEVAKQSILRLDLKTGLYELIDPFKFLPKGRQHAPYGMAADRENNLYFMDFADENIGRIDAKTGATTIYPTPTPKSRPRRTMLDDQGRLWFTEFAANKLGMFDTKTEVVQGVGRADAAHLSVRCLYGQERRVMERRHGKRSRAAVRSAERAVDRISFAAIDQYSPRLRRQFDQSGDILGRQQSRRGNFARRAARLAFCSASAGSRSCSVRHA